MEQTVQEISNAGLTSSALAAILGGIVGGFLGIVGAVVGQIVSHWLRRRGKVRCFVPDLIIRRAADNRLGFAFDLSFYNDRDVDIGLSDLFFTYTKPPKYALTARINEAETGAAIGQLDLPPRRWVTKQIAIFVRADPTAIEQGGEDHAEIHWAYPSGKKVAKSIPTRMPSYPMYGRSRWRRLFGA